MTESVRCSESRSTAIEVRQLVKTYRTGKLVVEALKGVSLRVTGPGFYGIMGPSGSGKSTLLHLIGGLDTPDSGEIEVDGQVITGLSDKKLTAFRRRRIGIIFQQFNLIPTMTALENVMLPGVLDGQRDVMLRPRALDLLGRLGLTSRVDHRPDALSGGEQQRVAMARSLLFSPGILLADEPTGNLDSKASVEVWEMLRNLAEEERVTILMVTHEASAAAYCSEVFLIGDGRVIDRIEVGHHDAVWLAHRAQQSSSSTR